VYATAKVPVLLLLYGSTLIFMVPPVLAVNDRALDHPESAPAKIDEPLLYCALTNTSIVLVPSPL
jgi:hypothetical protein